MSWSISIAVLHFLLLFAKAQLVFCFQIYFSPLILHLGVGGMNKEPNLMKKRQNCQSIHKFNKKILLINIANLIHITLISFSVASELNDGVIFDDKAWAKEKNREKIAI